MGLIALMGLMGRMESDFGCGFDMSNYIRIFVVKIDL